MLLAGFVVRNIPVLSDVTYISNELSSTLRNTALTIILVRAGLGLDPEVDLQLHFEFGYFKY